MRHTPRHAHAREHAEHDNGLPLVAGIASYGVLLAGTLVSLSVICAIVL